MEHADEDTPLRLWRRGLGAWAAPDLHEFYTVPQPVGGWPRRWNTTARPA
ncbi:MAG: hypothetical protein ACRD01_03480 [Terriglobales bacterium]